jgi:hypothetical protein
MQPKDASNFESTGGPQPAAGHVKPMLAGPPEAPIAQFCPFPSQPMPGQKRTPAMPMSGMSYSMELLRPGS